MLEQEIDKEEDGHTTFDTAMLVNINRCVDGMQTELYDSGASCHMSPYCNHLEDYVQIAPKPITAADKHYFQAIGKGNLQIKIPNGQNWTNVLLRDILHCPDMGLTLISIGKITNARYQVIFKGPACRIYDSKDRIISQINARNGLYCINHPVAMNTAMAGETPEVLMLEEIHC